jgi:hypothetical protein
MYLFHVIDAKITRKLPFSRLENKLSTPFYYVAICRRITYPKQLPIKTLPFLLDLWSHMRTHYESKWTSPAPPPALMPTLLNLQLLHYIIIIIWPRSLSNRGTGDNRDTCDNNRVKGDNTYEYVTTRCSCRVSESIDTVMDPTPGHVTDIDIIIKPIRDTYGSYNSNIYDNLRKYFKVGAVHQMSNSNVQFCGPDACTSSKRGLFLWTKHRKSGYYLPRSNDYDNDIVDIIQYHNMKARYRPVNCPNQPHTAM